MGRIRARLAALERTARKRLQTRTWWNPPIVDVVGDGTPEDEARIETIYREAIAAGWRPAGGTPAVIIVHRPEDDGGPPVEAS